MADISQCTHTICLDRLLINMKEKLQKVVLSLNNFFDNTMKQDGMKHFIVGIALTCLLNLVLPTMLVIPLVLIVLVGKELAYDDKMHQGTPELRDLLWGIAGLVLGLL